jgi:hypothetical protein
MLRERNAHMLRTGLRVATALGLALALALGACGANSSLFSGSSLDLFRTSSKATGGKTDTADAPETDVECPGVSVRTGAATLMIGSKPGGGEPSALELRYQGTIIRTARECHVNAGVMTMKVGIEGRVITGPAGGPGTVDVPLRIAVVHEGVSPRTVASKLVHIPVTVTGSVDRVLFTHVEPDISFPMPQPAGDIDAYVVYTGFDSMAAAPDRKRPAARPKRPAKPKQG